MKRVGIFFMQMGSVAQVVAFVFFYFWTESALKIARQDCHHLRTVLNELKKEVETYDCQIRAREENTFLVEKKAREELQMARPGEIVYIYKTGVKEMQ